MKDQVIPKATARRLPLYYRYLRMLHDTGKNKVSSTELSEAVQVDSATIRRDFSYFGELGKRGYGYDVENLMNFFAKTLNEDELTNVALIGVGNLGSAILKYNRWQYTVGKIVCGYDMDKNKEGERFGVKICHIDKLEETFPSDCKIAILAISENVQETVDRLMKLGIKGIVDFTHSHFMVQEGVEVQTVDVVVAIQELVIKMKSNDQE